MPIYEYACESCGHRLEVIQKLSDAPLTLCPACEKPALAKQISAAGFKLKGSGWYQTDFRGGGKGKKEDADTGTSGTSSETPKAGCGGGACGCH